MAGAGSGIVYIILYYKNILAVRRILDTMPRWNILRASTARITVIGGIVLEEELY